MDALSDQSEWDEATARVCAFLSASHMGGIEHRLRLALRVLDDARRRYDRADGLAPVEVAMDVAADSLDQWFARAIGESADHRGATGIVALEITDAATRFPNALLSHDPPQELKAMLAGVSLRTGPDLSISRMTPRQMDYGAMEAIAQETWHRFGWAPLLRAAGIWTAIFFIALYAHNRFFPQ